MKHYFFIMLLCCVSLYLSAQVKSLKNKEIQNGQGQVMPLDIDDNQQKTVFAVGSAQIINGNLALARKKALQVAYAEAVGQGAGISVNTLTLVKNVKDISDVVTSKSQGVITSYEILSENIKESGNTSTLVVNIQAEVATTPLTEDSNQALKLFLSVLGSPKIFILMPQHDATMNADSYTSQTEIRMKSKESEYSLDQKGMNVSSISRDYAGSPQANLSMSSLQTTEAAIASAMNQYGYNTITADMVNGVDQSMIELARRGDTVAAIRLARESGASVLIVGNLVLASRRISPQGVSFEQVSAELAARAFITSTKAEVKTLYSYKTRAHSNMLSAAASIKSEIAKDIADQLAWELPKILANSNEIKTLTISSLSFNDAQSVATGLSEVSGVIKSQIMQIPSKNTPAVIEIHTSLVGLSNAELVDTIRSVLNVNLEVIQQGRMDLSLKVLP